MSTNESSESQHQIGFVNWFRLRFPEVLLYHIPNGGFRNIVTARRLVAEGVVAGIPDLHIPAWRTWIEMKKVSGGVVSKDQERIKLYLESIGDTVIIARGATDASIQILKLKRNV